ncbi:receptor-like protein 6 [Eucalyptus grandis]|uniref:receptor-like protein 6 n=1 Tax=Eucalyptus grandis TaxID=71139 RepID=UPI00192EEA7B|nr:receptor-like protein 6 [Eucalyptus grandis]
MKKESLHFSYMILLLTIVVSRSLASTQRRCHEDERSALLEFKTTFFTRKRPYCYYCYDNASVEQAKIESWNASEGKTQSNCCSWTGVECDKVSGHVIGLDLSCSCLFGKINSNISIFRLLRLRSLNLAFNDFNCPIPSTIGNLGSLRDLNFSSSNFMGHISHSLRNLTRLVHLDLSENYLTGTIPTYFGSMLNLEHLSLSENRFVGEIPSSFERLGHLKHLDLGFNSLTGEIPSFLGNLVQLKYLSLADNELIGQIPSFLGNLVQLKYLSLANNELIGKIPSSIRNLVQLTTLHLSQNQLTGDIPSSIGDLIQLTDIDLGFNRLVGEIPLSFQNLLELRFLNLQLNRLSGAIPSLLGRLTQLTDVDLSLNQFHGAIPSTIFQSQGLNALYLTSNNLSGTVKLDMFSEAKNLRELVLSSNKLSLISETNITHRYWALGLGSCNLNSFPEFLQDQNDLQVLDLSYNNISGQVPKWFLNVSIENLELLNLSSNFLTSFAQDPVIFKWKELFEADLGFNELQGSVPIPPPEIESYFISNNRLLGGISPLLCNLSHISAIDFSDNNLTGFIPQCFSNLSGYLEVLNLRSNNFIGKIPELNGNFYMIDLSYNKLEGPLPRSLRNCNKLQFLNFANNHIRDVFPSWLGSLLSLRVLILRDNRFHGFIEEPTNRIEFPMLQIIDLSQNSFSGSLPSKYFKHWTAIGIQMNYSKIQGYLTLIDLSSNDFSGAIPETIGSLKQLKLLNLSNNMLSGPLPPFLANLTNLEALDLSQNQLSGEISQDLTQLTSLEVSDVSYNCLIGPIPKLRQFATFENISYKGNSGLCGAPLSKKCGYPEASPPSFPTSEEDQDSGSAMELDWKIVCMGYASGLVIGVVLGNCLITRRRAQSLVKNFGRRKQRRRR